jgi:NAD-dependent dihydropyrimidine dehydrogenase PreA subunit
VELIPDRCENNGKCVEICPAKVIIHSEASLSFEDGHSLDWYPVVCDLCAGKPECVRICPTGAIFSAERPDFNPAAE